MCRWFTNHGKVQPGGTTTASTQIAVSSKPRATNAISLFAKDHSDKITAQMATLRAEEGTNPKESNLRYHQIIKKNMFENADSATRAEYAAKAEALNAKLSSIPDPSEIFQ
jgi:hypothetical protein